MKFNSIKKIVLFSSFLSVFYFFYGCGSSGGNTNGNSVTGSISLSAPLNVMAVAKNGSITITWDSVTSATSYNIYMAQQSGITKSNYSTKTDGMKHTNVTSPFTHSGLTSGSTYYFVVTAVNYYGESSESSEVSAVVAKK